MVDSIKVYTKTKEAFVWPEDSDDSLDSTLAKAPQSTSATQATDATADSTSNSEVTSPMPLSSIDKWVELQFFVAPFCCTKLRYICHEFRIAY